MKSSEFRAVLAITAGLLVALPAGARAADRPPLAAGQVIESVACIQAPDQTYSIYLPSAYTPARTWPVIYAFDPGARGALPVQRLQVAAERFGYIVIGSNVSRNFEPKLSVEAADAMWADSHVRLSIDNRRVYTLGFSGGARLAAGLAVVSMDFAGVIACGAAFDSKHPPRDRRPALFAGIVGLEDMNYPEMRDAEDRLREAQVTHRLFFFDGGHEWPPADVFLDVLTWLQLRAIRDGFEPPDPAFLEAEFQRRSESATRARISGSLLEVGRIYEGLLEDFEGLIDVGAITAQLNRLRGESAYRQSKKRDRRLRTEEDEWLRKLDRQFVKIRNTPMESCAIDGAVKDWSRQIEGLRKRRDTSRDADERRLYLRLHEFVWRRAYEEAILHSRHHEYIRTALLLEIARCGMPDEPALLFSLGKTYARLADEDRAIRFLAAAVTHGFRDASALSDPVFTGLERRPEFQSLRQQLSSNPVTP
ncbi:MAG TPA: hypothetical protein PLY66_08845 [Acidobacteriota bacterium]|nr:hypothetical protein [Acidobacteriota bacterium]HQF87165.1 hypothetical protein [Acidobacteriota bacterium]HQG91726.1 hypothetical protein [Acidobacteriota bacterium]HQK86144.1 hypothetical protein [Acidobacteriota bacterium]